MSFDLNAKYAVYLIADTGMPNPPLPGTIQGFIHIGEFETHEKAYEWIKYKGNKNLNYTILEVFKKP